MGKIQWAAFLAVAGGLSLSAQENWCSDHGWRSDGMVAHHEVREEHLAAAPENVVNPAQNGSIHVHGWANSDILVKACVQTSAHDQATADMLARQVTITDGPGRVVAKGPANSSIGWWSVSYDVWVPSAANLEMKADNGSIHTEGTMGRIRTSTENGSITLTDVGGTVDGQTTNGSVSVNVTMGSTAQPNGLKLKTVNGSIHLKLPESYGAEVEASTVNGSIKSDFGDLQNTKEKHNLRFTIGGGGSKIDADTVNGSVHIQKES